MWEQRHKREIYAILMRDGSRMAIKPLLLVAALHHEMRNKRAELTSHPLVFEFTNHPLVTNVRPGNLYGFHNGRVSLYTRVQFQD